MNAQLVPPLVLRNGAAIEDPLGTALEFIAQDSSYRNYDQAPVKEDALLTEADIRVANSMIARMSPEVIAGIFARSPAINAALAQIPTSASLAAPDDAVPWVALEELMRAMQGIPAVKLARSTKVLHKKRPALIPILDSVLETYLRRADGMRRTGDAARDAIDLIRSYKRELDATLPTLQALQAELRLKDIHLTECRLLDLFLWGYSGTYTPLYLRDESVNEGGAPAPQAAGTSSAREPLDVIHDSSLDVRVFRDDESGYFAWLSTHPSGFVLNAARNPAPSYLILHRATCRTISGRSTRGGPWTGSYIKICGDDELHIAAWTGLHVGAAPTRCGVCEH